MGRRDEAKMLRIPGRVVVNPLDAFYGDATFPFGGIEVGASRMCVLTPTATDHEVWSESTGEITAVIEGGCIWKFSCILRDWDDQAIQLLTQDEQEQGEVSQRRVFRVPGNREPGTSAEPRGVRLAYIPDDALHVPGIMLYRAIPEVSGGLDFQRAAEFGLPLNFTCLRDDADRILEVGIMADLSPV